MSHQKVEVRVFHVDGSHGSEPSVSSPIAEELSPEEGVCGCSVRRSLVFAIKDDADTEAFGDCPKRVFVSPGDRPERRNPY